MKTIIMIFSILCTSHSLKAQKSIEGIWDTGQENTQIEIRSSNTSIEGKIFTSNNKRATVGKLMIKHIVEEQNNTYNGKLYIIKHDKWVDAVFVRVGDKMKITVSKGFREKTIEWNLLK